MNDQSQVNDVVQSQVNDVEEKPKKKRGRPPKAKKAKKAEKVVSNPVDNTQSTRIAELESQLKLLTSALLSSKNAQEDSEDDPTIGVVKTGGSNLSMFLTDAYGRQKHFYWEEDGQVLYMTPAQYEEIFTLPGGKKFFDNHWLQLESEDLNLYMDTDEFIGSLEYEDIHEHIEEIDEPSILQRIISHLESTRVVTEDEEGQPFKDENGLPMAKIIEWDVKQRMVAQACAEKLYKLTGVKYSLSDG